MTMSGLFIFCVYLFLLCPLELFSHPLAKISEIFYDADVPFPQVRLRDLMAFFLFYLITHSIARACHEAPRVPGTELRKFIYGRI
jgi:hypothetical protein